MDIVVAEKNLLREASQTLLSLLDKIDLTEDDANKPEANRLILEVSEHLSNIGGFCDSWTRQRIHVIQGLMSMSFADPLHYLTLKDMLPYVVGIQVDYSKRPFRAISLSIEALGAKFKAKAKR